MKKRLLATLLALAMLLSTTPFAWAASPDSGMTAPANDVATEGAVAQVGDTPYTSLPEAITAAYSDSSKTVTLLADVTLDATNVTSGGGATVLNLTQEVTITSGTGGPFTIKGSGFSGNNIRLIGVGSGANVTLDNVILDGGHVQDASGTATTQGARHGLNIWEAGTVTLTDVTIQNCDWYGMVVNGSTSTVTATNLTTTGNEWGVNVDNGANLTLAGTTNISEASSVVYENVGDMGGSLTIEDGKYQNIVVKTDASETQDGTVEVKGGTFNAIVKEGSGTLPTEGVITVSGGTFAEPAAGTTVGAGTTVAVGDHLESGATVDDDGTVVPADAVAKVGNQTYSTLHEAITGALASDNATVTLLKNANLTQKVTINKNLTIEGGNFTITGVAGDSSVNFEVTGGTFTIQNVTLDQFGSTAATDSGIAVIKVPDTADAATKIVASEVNVTNFCRSAYDIRSGSFEITGGSINCGDTGSGATNSRLTKGIMAGYGSNMVTGTISNVDITNSASNYSEWSSAGIEIYQNADVTITGGTITNVNNGISVDNYYGSTGTGATVNVENVTVEASGNAIRVYGNSTNENTPEATVTVTGGQLTGDIKVINGTTGADSLTDSKENITITDATITGDVSNAGGQIQISGGTITGTVDTSDPSGNTIIDVPSQDPTAVAEVDGQQYSSLQLALAAVSDGGTITLLADVTLDATGVASANGAAVLKLTKNVTITSDENGPHTITGQNFQTNVSLIGVENGANVTLDNVILDGGHVETGDTVTTQGARHGLNVWNAGEVTLTDVTIQNCDWYGMVVNGSTSTVTATNLTTTGNEWGVNVDNGANLTLAGTTNISEASSVVYENVGDMGGSLTIEDGEYQNIVVKTENGETQAGTVEVTGGTFNAIVKEGDGTLPTEGVITVSGGTFAVPAAGTTVGAGTTVAVEDYLAEGKDLNENGTVVEATPVAQVNDTPYYDLQQAINAAAENGSTVTLLTDVELAGATDEAPLLNIPGDVTITSGDGGPFTITATFTGGRAAGDHPAVDIPAGSSLTLDGVNLTVTGVEDTTVTPATNAGDGIRITGSLNVENGSQVELNDLKRGVISMSTDSQVKVDGNGSSMAITNSSGNATNGGNWTVSNGASVSVDGAGSHGLSTDTLTVDGATVSVTGAEYAGIVAGKTEIINGSEVTISNSGTSLPLDSAYSPDGESFKNVMEIKEDAQLTVSDSTLTIDDTNATDTDDVYVSANTSPTITNSTITGDVEYYGDSAADTITVNFADEDGTIYQTMTVTADENGNYVFTLPDGPGKTGYTLQHWEYGTDIWHVGDEVTLTADEVGEATTITFTAVFAPVLTVNFVSDGSTVSTLNNVTAAHEEYTFATHTAPTKDGYTFRYWSWNGNTYGASESVTLTADEVGDVNTLTFTAVFAQDLTVNFVSDNVTVQTNAVTFDVTNEYYAVTTPAAPTKAGYTFQHWSWNGSTYGANESVTLTVDEVGEATTITFTAVFTQNNVPGGGGGGIVPPPQTPSVSVEDTTNGTVNVSNPNAQAGQQVTITATPDDGYQTAQVTVTDSNGNPVAVTPGTNGQYTFTMPVGGVSVQVSFAPLQMPFTDVPANQWYYSAVEYAWRNGLMVGTSDTTFGPLLNTTRAQLVTILYRLEGEPALTATPAHTYDDVLAGSWYANAVYWAQANGIVQGYSDTAFGPEDLITREQLAAFLYRYAQYKGYDVSASGDLSVFTDAANVSGWALPSMQWAVGETLIQGVGSNLVDPTGYATRAQLAAVLMRFIQNVAQQ